MSPTASGINYKHTGDRGINRSSIPLDSEIQESGCWNPLHFVAAATLIRVAVPPRLDIPADARAFLAFSCSSVALACELLNRISQ